MPEKIISRSNPLIKRVRLLGAEAAVRREEGAFIAEGPRLVEEALAARARLECVLHSPRLSVTERGRRLLGRLAGGTVRVVETSDTALDSISDAETSQGIIAVVLSGAEGQEGIGTKHWDAQFWVVGWGLQDPGNLGTLLRSADAAGSDLFATVAGTVDPTSPKAVRASAGSIFRMPFARGIPPKEILDAAHARGVRLLGTAPEGGRPYYEADYRGPIGFVFGREGEGLPPAVNSQLSETITIPMRRGVESLNVAAAAAVVLFEAARVRRSGPGSDRIPSS